jgi:hypothetical protein
VQADQPDHVPVVPSHVLICVPQLPHDCDDAPLHVCPEQVEPHWQLPPQVCDPPWPHGCVEFGAHGPSPAQADHADQVPDALSHVRVCVPQLPHAVDEGPVHVSLMHALHVQSPRHDCTPPSAHGCVALGAQAPSPAQGSQADQFPVVLSQVRVCVPQ